MMDGFRNLKVKSLFQKFQVKVISFYGPLICNNFATYFLRIIILLFFIDQSFSKLKLKILTYLTDFNILNTF